MKSKTLSRRAFLQTSAIISSTSWDLTSNHFAHETPNDLEKIAEIFSTQKPVKWLFTGDSITQGAKHTHGMRSFPEIFAERVRWELGRVNDVVINTGNSGNMILNILNDFEWRVAQFSPSVVFLMIGTNDCAKNKNIKTEDFEANLAVFVEKTKKLNAIPILLTPNFIITEKSRERERLELFINATKHFAIKENIIVVDNWELWKTENKDNYVFKNWLNDPIHPNGTGHQEIAHLIFKTLSIFNADHATCGGKYFEGEH